MRKMSFQKAFLLRSREAVRLLGRLPLSDVNRQAMEVAARRACVDALLAVNPGLVQACHDISILASSASGPGIPEGPARLRSLRAALRRAEWTALRNAEWSAGLVEISRSARQDVRGRGFSGCPCAQTALIRGRIPVPSSLLERAKSLGMGLRILRFRPGDLRKTPQELSDKLANLALRGTVLGLFALTGRRTGSPAREFALFLADHSPETGAGPEEADPLKGLPVTGLIRTLLAAGEESVPDLRGLELVDVLPSWDLDSRSGKGGIAPETSERQARIPDIPDSPGDEAAPEARKFSRGSVAGRAVREGAVLDGEYRSATVLHADIVSFLQTVKGLEPAKAAEFLNLVLSRFSRGIEAADGIADAFIGSSLYAYWGAPAATGRDAASAADAALALRKALRAINRNRAASGKAIVRMVCGLDSGSVLAGRTGPSLRRSYTVAGEAPRRACLIGALNESLGTDILVSGSTLGLMGNAFLTHPVGALRTGVHGEPIPVHALIGRRGDPSCPRDLKDLRERLDSGV